MAERPKFNIYLSKAGPVDLDQYVISHPHDELHPLPIDLDDDDEEAHVQQLLSSG